VTLHPSNSSARPATAGHGAFDVENVNGKSVPTRVMAHSPLRLLTPRNCPGKAAWVFTSTFGGGLVSGDQIDLHARVGKSANCVLATQSSTKVFRAAASASGPTRQALHMSIADSATCAILPDPLTCFAGSAFEQSIRIDLAASASVVLLDWLTSGRRARGERWAFDRYASRIEAAVDGKLTFRDAVLLDQSFGRIDDVHRMGRCDCFGIVLLLGPRIAAAADAILAWAAAQPIDHGNAVIFSASPVPGGAVIRVAGPATETVGRWIRTRLGFLEELLGGDPWSRKW
jgi:urease accessory protein